MMRTLMWVVLLAVLLAACSTSNESTPGAPAAAPVAAAPAPAVAAPAPEPSTAPEPALAPAPIAVATPAQRAPKDLLIQGGVDYGCKVPADCAIKDVGNCCGQYPACVNKDSPTFPDKVKADCAASGMSSVCGFPSIASCDCIEGRCTGLTGNAPDAPLQ